MLWNSTSVIITVETDICNHGNLKCFLVHTSSIIEFYLARLPKLLLKSSHIEIISLFLSSVNIVVDSCFCKNNLYAPKFQLTIIELTLD